jgi:hypothetical protein
MADNPQEEVEIKNDTGTDLPVSIIGATDDTPIGNVDDALKITTDPGVPLNVADAWLEIAKGNVTGTTGVNKYGFNPSVSPNNFEDVWDGSSLYVFPTVARTVNVKSTSTDDDSTGTGARTVLLEGLDSNYDEITETITLNGTTDVLSTNSFLRLHRMKIMTCGGGEHNAGDITATSTTDLLLLAQITENLGQTQMCLYTVPAGKTAYVVDWHITVIADMDMALFTREINSCFQAKRKVIVSEADVQEWKPYLKLPEKTDIRVEALSGTGNNAVSSELNIVLVDN